MVGFWLDDFFGVESLFLLYTDQPTVTCQFGLVVWDSKGTLEFHKGIPGIQTTTPNQQCGTNFWREPIFWRETCPKDLGPSNGRVWTCIARVGSSKYPVLRVQWSLGWKTFLFTFLQLFWMNILAEEVNISKMSSGKKNTNWLYVCFGRTEISVTSFLGYPQVNRILEFSWLFWTNAGWWNI